MSYSTSNVRARQKDWISNIKEKSGHSFSKIAKEAGLAQTTVSRFMDDTQSSGALSAQTEEKIRSRYPDISISTDEKSEGNTGMAFPKKSHENGSYGLVTIPEYDVQISAGGGAVVQNESNDSAAWTIPRQNLLPFSSNPNNLRIITVRGDSMEPDYRPGDKVLVDIGQKSYTHDGVYALDFGFGLVLKNLQLIVGSSPTIVEVISRNALYPSQKVELSNAGIRGRVVAKWAQK